ncbi:MAG: metallophosphoesterase [Bacteroidales bacterium]
MKLTHFSLLIPFFILTISCKKDLDYKPKNVSNNTFDQLKKSEYYQELKKEGRNSATLDSLLYSYSISQKSQSFKKTDSQFGQATFYAIADPQMENNHSEVVNKTIANMQNLGQKAMNENRSIFVLGDLTQNGRQDEFRYYNEGRKINGQTNTSNWITLEGNHDVDPGALNNRTAWIMAVPALRNAYMCLNYATKSPDQYYWYHSFNKEENQSPIKGGTVSPAPHSETFIAYEYEGFSLVVLGNCPHFEGQTGQISSDGTSAAASKSLDFFNSYLVLRNQKNGTGGFPKRTQPIIILMHQPFRSNLPINQHAQGYQHLSQIMNSQPVVATITGHLHYNRFRLLPSDICSTHKCYEISLVCFSTNFSYIQPEYFKFNLDYNTKVLTYERYNAFNNQKKFTKTVLLDY